MNSTNTQDMSRKRYILDKSSAGCYEKGKKNPFTYCVIYRDGTRDCFKWIRTYSMTYEEALETSKSMESICKTIAYCENYQRSLNVGLPETFDPKDKLPA